MPPRRHGLVTSCPASDQKLSLRSTAEIVLYTLRKGVVAWPPAASTLFSGAVSPEYGIPRGEGVSDPASAPPWCLVAAGNSGRPQEDRPPRRRLVAGGQCLGDGDAGGHRRAARRGHRAKRDARANIRNVRPNTSAPGFRSADEMGGCSEGDRLVRAFLAILLATAACSEDPARSDLAGEVRSLRSLTVPPKATTTGETSLEREGAQTEARWAFSTTMPRADYNDWVRRRLAAFGYRELDRQLGATTFGRTHPGDAASLTVAVSSRGTRTWVTITFRAWSG